MQFKEFFYNVWQYVYLIVIIGSFFFYFTNVGDVKDEAKFCAASFNDALNPNINLMYWQEHGYCCHYALDRDRIVQECQT